MSFKPFDVVVVPFPFTDRTSSKRRPALVISEMGFNSQIGHSVLAMITSAKHSNWPLDSAIEELHTAGLPSPSIVRMKLFTLDDRLVIRKAGELSPKDRLSVKKSVQQLLQHDLG